MASNRSRYCFYPTQDVKQIDYPCFPDEAVSPCCSNDMSCLGNGLCYNEITKMVTRGTCTDRTWNSPYCPQFCLENEFKGNGAHNYSEHSVPTWTCSDQWAGEGGLMCCNIFSTFSGEFNKSCCPDAGAINLFSIGSKPGTAKSIHLSTSSLPSRSSALEAMASLSSFSSSATSFITAKPTAASSEDAFPVSSPAPSHSKNKGSIIAMAVGISVGAIVLIIASVLIHQFLRRRNQRNTKQDLFVEEIVQSGEDSDDIKELNGQPYHEMPSSGQQKHELPCSEQQDHELPCSGQEKHELPCSGQEKHELPCSKQHQFELPAKSKYLRQELAG